MTDSYSAELRDIIDRAFTGQHGGQATAAMVQQTVQHGLPDHLTDYLVNKGLRSRIGSYFREQDSDGLVMRPSVNAAAEHRQLDLLTVSEHAYVYASYVDRSDANLAQAEKQRIRCLEQHGVDLIAHAGVSA